MPAHRCVAVLLRDAGFTLVELVIVMVLVGILSVVVMPRFFDTTFSERGFHDGVKAAVQHARRTAVASRRFVCVTISPGAGAAGVVAVSLDVTAPEPASAKVDCTAPVVLPALGGCAPNQICAPRGVTLGPVGGVSAIFDPLGRSVTAAKAVAGKLVISVSGQPDITIESETGWIQ